MTDRYIPENKDTPIKCIYGLECDSVNVIGNCVILCPKHNYDVCFNHFTYDEGFPLWCPEKQKEMEWKKRGLTNGEISENQIKEKLDELINLLKDCGMYKHSTNELKNISNSNDIFEEI